MQTDPNQTPNENDEIDVTEIIERLEKLEKEKSSFKEIEIRLADLEESFDSLAGAVGELAESLGDLTRTLAGK